ncbi:MAG: hypothetical protein JXR68_03110 [Bacteroidales bacterium]|nr:hypothetical protein [Bacteroidales bacterium]
MSDKVLYKSDFLLFSIFTIIVFLLQGLIGFVNDYLLFFVFYTSIWYFISSIILKKLDLLTNNIMIKYPLSFLEKE